MKGKLILITGGSSGIGKASALELHKQGAEVILVARNKEKLRAAVNDISPSKERIHVYSADLAESYKAEALAQQVINEVGLPDVIINSAGAGEWLPFKDAKVSHFKETMDSPYLATANSCKAFFDLMQERGTGHFIIINSAAAYFSFPAATGYGPARWAMLGFAKSLQADLAKTEYHVSLVTIGKVQTEYFTNNPVSEENIPKISNLFLPTLSVAKAGKIIAKTVRTKRANTNQPVVLGFFLFLNRLFPGVFRWLMRG